MSADFSLKPFCKSVFLNFVVWLVDLISTYKIRIQAQINDMKMNVMIPNVDEVVSTSIR